MRIALGTMMVLLAVGAPAQAQEPINLSVHVTELSQIFTQLYGPEGLVVNSLTPLENGQTHSGISTAASRASSRSSGRR